MKLSLSLHPLTKSIQTDEEKIFDSSVIHAIFRRYCRGAISRATLNPCRATSRKRKIGSQACQSPRRQRKCKKFFNRHISKKQRKFAKTVERGAKRQEKQIKKKLKKLNKRIEKMTQLEN